MFFLGWYTLKVLDGKLNLGVVKGLGFWSIFGIADVAKDVIRLYEEDALVVEESTLIFLLKETPIELFFIEEGGDDCLFGLV